jgi:hypothetical protein
MCNYYNEMIDEIKKYTEGKDCKSAEFTEHITVDLKTFIINTRKIYLQKCISAMSKTHTFLELTESMETNPVNEIIDIKCLYDINSEVRECNVFIKKFGNNTYLIYYNKLLNNIEYCLEYCKLDKHQKNFIDIYMYKFTPEFNNFIDSKVTYKEVINFNELLKFNLLCINKYINPLNL